MENIKLFESQKIRSSWDNEQEKWFFSIVDIIAALTDSNNPQVYWRVLKKRLLAEGNETVTNCNGLKMVAPDGKMRLTDVADTEQLFRLIQSIPSPKAEPFKQWLAKIGYERIEESQDPEKAIDRAMENYLNLGYSTAWINQRLKSIEVRKELTDEWENKGVKKREEFASLTDIITQAWSGNTVKQYKNLKGLKKENLRDNMTNLELVLNMLAEATTTEISKENNPKTFADNKRIALKGGEIAGDTRKQIEEQTGKKIVSSQNAKVLKEKNDKLKE
ncbi:Bro-N domain-containing protein [Flavobacterium sp. LT1R49]|uniref:BRO-N domain-containing protein n=1 Tax=Flavobacterium arabinosi TaxID=3398737 RepID=UPI003A86B980